MAVAWSIHAFGFGPRGPNKWAPQIVAQLSRDFERLAIPGHLVPTGKRANHTAVIHRDSEAAVFWFFGFAPAIGSATENLADPSAGRIISVINFINRDP